MKDLATYAGGVPVKPEDLEHGLQHMQQSIQGGTGGTPFLRLLKSGLFVYGAENIEVEEGSEWAVNPYSMQHGWACWGEGELLDERMVPFTQEPPNKAELPDLGQPWQQNVSMLLQCASGEDEGVQVLYKGTSLGLRNAVKDLISALLGQLQNDKQHIVPLVTLESDSYNHKQYGQIFYPILEVTKWVSIDDIADVAEPEESEEAEPTAEAEPEPEQKPARRRGRTSKAAAKADKPATARRRRRRQS